MLMKIMKTTQEKFKKLLETVDQNYRENRLLLFSLFEFMDNKIFEKTLHQYSIAIINSGQSKNISKFSKAVVLSSLSMIAFQKYDGNFWDNVFEIYYDLDLSRNNRQSIENEIRDIIRTSMPDNIETKRIINYVLMQTIVPKKYLFDFINILDIVYKYDLRGYLPEDLHEIDEVIDEIFKQISEKASSNDDYYKSSALNKSYKLVQTTREVISNNFYRQELIKFSKMILVLLDKHYNNDEAEIKDHYLYNLMNDYILIEQISKDFKVDKEDKFIWRSNLIFEEGQLFLETKSLLFDIEKSTEKIYIEILSDGSTIKIIHNPRIITRDTTSELYSIRLPIDFSPFNLKIIIHGIPNKNQLIQNKYLFFSTTSGRKVTDIHNLNEILVIYPQSVKLHANAQDTHSAIFYNLAFLNRIDNECFKIDNDTYCFGLISKSKLLGDKFQSLYLNYDNKELEIYKEKPQLIHIKEKYLKEVILKLNETSQTIAYSNYVNEEIILELSALKIGFNELSIFDSNFNLISESRWLLYYDPNIKHEFDEESEEIIVQLTGYKLYKYPLKTIEPAIISIKINQFIDLYVRHITPRAMISENETVDITKYFWIADMPTYKEVHFIGVNKTNLIVKDNQYNVISDRIDYTMTKYGATFKIDISILKAHNQNGYLVFFDLIDEEITIPVLAHNAFIKEDISIEVSDNNVIFSIDNLTGKNLNTIQISNYGFALELKDVNLKEKLNVNLPFNYVHYKYIIIENNRSIFEGEFYCINKEFLIGQTFRIKNLSYYQNYESNLIETSIHNTFLRITAQISKNKFHGTLFYMTQSGDEHVMYNLDPVTLVFLSKITNLDDILIDIFYDDISDEAELRLLYNDIRKQIVNSIDESKVKNINLIEDISIKWENSNEK